MSARNFNSTRCDLWDHRLRALCASAKLAYLYLLTSHRSNALGLFLALPDHVAVDTGLSVAEAQVAMVALVDADLVDYDATTGTVFVRAWYRHNPIHTVKNAAHVLALLRGDEMPPAEASNALVRAAAVGAALNQLARFPDLASEIAELGRRWATDAPSMPHRCPIDGASARADGLPSLPFPSPAHPTHPSRAPTAREDIAEPPFRAIVAYLNERTGSAFRTATKKTRECISARWREEFRLDDFKTVIDDRVRAWAKKPDMREYLRPETLFGNKFEGYLQAARKRANEPAAADDLPAVADLMRAAGVTP